MDLLSWQFAVFSLVVLAVYYALSRKAQNVWLLLASYVFYLSWAWQSAVVLAITTLINFGLAQRIEAQALAKKDKKASERGVQVFLILGLLWNVVALLVFRFSDSGYGRYFYREFFNLSLNSRSIWTHFLLPVGFSFYTLQAISYLIDVSRRQLPASRNLVDFALYMAYFPKLTAGPIERARGFLKILSEPRRVDNAAIARSLTLIVVGLVRKLVIAVTLTQMIPADLFSNPGGYGSAYLWFGILAYSFLLYNDFAGYTSLMRGLSGLFGIELNLNFNQPYFSRSFTEFWTRWHISLSNWLRDYIYFPLSRALLRRFPNPRHPLNLVVPPMVTMLVSGLWHGLSLGMLLWGGLHGLYQAAERLFAGGKPRQAQGQQPLWRQVSGALTTFFLTMLAWVPFATGDFSNALIYWRRMVTLRVNTNSYVMPYGWILGAIGLSLWVDWCQYHAADEGVFLKWARPAQAFLLALAIFLMVATLGRAVDVSGFVYQGF